MDEAESRAEEERLLGEARKLDSLFEAAHRAEIAIDGVVDAVREALARGEPAVQEQGRYVIERLQRMLSEA